MFSGYRLFTADVWLMLLLCFIMGQVYLVLDNFFVAKEKQAREDAEADMDSAFAMSMWMGQD